jgi:hypothetical protein
MNLSIGEYLFETTISKKQQSNKYLQGKSGN